MDLMMQIEVVYGTATKQTLLSCKVPTTAVVKDAIDHSGILKVYPELSLTELKLGVFSKPVELNTPLKSGDRVEIYRPLVMDPKTARRLRYQPKSR